LFSAFFSGWFIQCSYFINCKHLVSSDIISGHACNSGFLAGQGHFRELLQPASPTGLLLLQRKSFFKKIFVAKKLFFSAQQPPGRLAAPKNTYPGQ
jgi:hypothetical protein